VVVASVVSPCQLVDKPALPLQALSKIAKNDMTSRRNIFFDFIRYLFYGTGSKPPRLNGLQRRIRHVANKLPLIAPYL
jgi:hypothetical protein